MKWAGIEAECEVFNLFAGSIPQAGLSRIEKGRKRQGLVPDFLVKKPVRGQGNRVAVLAELKVLSSCLSRYPRNPRALERAVSRRANQLPGEYLRKAKKMDREFGNVQNTEIGPVEQKLSSYSFEGWVFGAWNEASPAIHELVHTIAKARVSSLDESEVNGLQRLSAKAALSVITGQVRRTMSLVSAQARCLLDRVDTLGSGRKEAVKRRKWVELEERRLSREQKAHMISLQTGRGILRRGEIYLQ